MHTFDEMVTAPDLAAEAYPRIFKTNVDFERGNGSVFVAEDVQLPPAFGIIFGDIMHNLHSALDNLVFALGKIAGRPTRESRFPIVNHENEWFTADVLAGLHAVRPHDRALIEAHQPFMRINGVHPDQNVLARIKNYSNEDKHRVITPVWGHAVVTSNNVVTERCDVFDVDQKSSPLRKNAEIITFSVRVTGPDPKVNMEATLALYPALGSRGEHVHDFTYAAIDYVRALIEQFRPSFG